MTKHDEELAVRLEKSRLEFRETFQGMSDEALTFQNGIVVGGIAREELDREINERRTRYFTGRIDIFGFAEAALNFLGDDMSDADYLPVSARGARNITWRTLFDRGLVTCDEVIAAAYFKSKVKVQP
jgi:hypothetical protein